jgi:hypothetical protein
MAGSGVDGSKMCFCFLGYPPYFFGYHLFRMCNGSGCHFYFWGSDVYRFWFSDM